tara:strand:+ start:434 stop:685 length:252 start_codon:yes stop_codon:yes gene_type:complete
MALTNPAKDAYINLLNIIEMSEAETSKVSKPTGLLSSDAMMKRKQADTSSPDTDVLGRVALYVKQIQKKRQEIKNVRETNSGI